MVKANETRSKNGSVTCEVPQGSILSPFLFFCYVNNMTVSIECIH